MLSLRRTSAVVVRPALRLAHPTAASPRSTLFPRVAALPSRRSLATAVAEGSQLTRTPVDSIFAPLDTFTRRHVGPQPASVERMLQHLGHDSMDAFIAQCVPPAIRLDTSVVSEEGDNAIVPLSEQELLRRAREIGAQNKVLRSFIGMGYHTAVSVDTSVGCWNIRVDPETIGELTVWFDRSCPKSFCATCSSPTAGLVSIPHIRERSLKVGSF